MHKYKYFELVFKVIKFTSLFYTLITFTNFCIKKSRLDVKKNASSRVGANIWTEMPNNLKKTYQGRPSKKNLKGALLRNGPDKNDSNNGEHVGMQKRC